MELKPQSIAQRKLIEAATRAAAHLPASHPPALFLTDPARTPDPVAIAERLPAGWGVVYRHFGAPNRNEIADKLAQTARIRGLRLLISADPSLAKTVSADGVHWPFAKRAEATSWRDTFKLLTISAHNENELKTAQTLDIDGVILSTVFTSASPSAGATVGATRFLQLSDRASRPIYALGGITADTVTDITPAPFASVSGIADAFAPRT